MSLVMTLSATLACPVDCTRVTSRPSPIAGNLGLLNSAGRPPTQLATRRQSRTYLYHTHSQTHAFTFCYTMGVVHSLVRVFIRDCLIIEYPVHTMGVVYFLGVRGFELRLKTWFSFNSSHRRRWWW